MNKVPEWMGEESLLQFKKSALPGELPYDAFKRVSDGDDELFEYLWKGYLGLATPVLANYKTDRGLPISCFSSVPHDSLDGIFETGHEIARLTKAGGGTAADMSDLRGRGAPIRGYGTSNGVTAWCKIYDVITDKVRQGNVRRGALAVYLDSEHADIDEFLRIRRPEGDPRNQCLDIHQGVKFSDSFMRRIEDGDRDARKIWAEVLKTRLETGEPYVFFSGNANADVNFPAFPEYKVRASNLCVSGDTDLLTKEFGYVKISNFVGRTVSVWNGDSWSETVVIRTGSDQKLLEITLSDGRRIKTTEYHKFYVKPDYHSLEKEVRANELKIGDKISKTRFQATESGFDEGLPDAYTAGFFAGDGTSSGSINFVDLYQEKQKLEQYIDVENFSNKSYNAEADRVRVRVSNKHSKDYVPVNSSIKYRLAYLAGYADADGTITDNKGAQSLQLASISLGRLESVQRLLETLGVDSKITKAHDAEARMLPDGKGGKKEYNCKEVYRLLVASAGLVKLGELGIEFRRLVFNKNASPNREALHFAKVVSIEEVEGLHDTYCVNEPINHKAVFNGILTGNCSEIFLHSDYDHTFVCCLSSLNLAKYDEWKNTRVVERAVRLLDDVMEEFIQKASKLPGFDKAVRFAVKSRAVGLGVMGFHTLLQKKRLAYGSKEAFKLNSEIFKMLRERSYKESEALGEERGVPEWVQGLGRRNSHLLAVAPTYSNSIVSGFVSEGINLIPANAYLHRSSQGSFIVRNKELESLGLLSEDDWKSVVAARGSVQHLKLDDHIKSVFLTAREINQLDHINMAGIRQPYIDQGQSLNLFCNFDVPKSVFNNWHITAWKLGLKSLYYVRASAATKGDVVNYSSDCAACEA